jgi:glyoxylase-like metal-dependent hydrolase (beta-lactamase superfamily II)
MATKFHTIVVGPFAVNCYLLWKESSSAGLIIDPGAEAETVTYWIDEFGLKPEAILLTHGHGDHIAAVAKLKKQYDIPVYIGAGDEELLANPSANISAFFDHPVVAPEPDHVVQDDQKLSIGGMQLTVIATPGHTVGGVCYMEESTGRLFCGDTLFAGSIGRTDLPGGNHQQLIDSIITKIMRLPDVFLVLPGHGPQSTVGAERTSNPWLIGGSYA